MTKFRYWIGILFALLIITNEGRAQDLPPEDEVPVDGGIGLLLAAGAAWGIKRLKDKK